MLTVLPTSIFFLITFPLLREKKNIRYKARASNAIMIQPISFNHGHIPNLVKLQKGVCHLEVVCLCFGGMDFLFRVAQNL